MANKKAHKPNDTHISLMISEGLYAWLEEKTRVYGSISQAVRVLLEEYRAQEGARRKKTG